MTSYLKLLILLISIGLSYAKEKADGDQGDDAHRKHVVVVSPPKSKHNSGNRSVVVVVNGKAVRGT